MKERTEAYLSRETIAARVAELGAELSAAHEHPEPLILIQFPSLENPPLLVRCLSYIWL